MSTNTSRVATTDCAFMFWQLAADILEISSTQIKLRWVLKQYFKAGLCLHLKKISVFLLVSLDFQHWMWKQHYPVTQCCSDIQLQDEKHHFCLKGDLELTLQGSWFTEISSLESHRSISKTSDLVCYQLVGKRPEQSGSFEERDAGASRRPNSKSLQDFFWTTTEQRRLQKLFSSTCIQCHMFC